MNLIAHKFDGRRAAVQHEQSHSYSKVLDIARDYFRFHNDTAALYLQADISKRIVRTFTRNEFTGGVEMQYGYHPWPEPPTMYPGRLPTLWEHLQGDQRGRPSAFPADEIGAMLERADRKGYERGFKVGIAHRNRERAAQLRQQAGQLDRVADRYPLPGSVRAGVYGDGSMLGAGDPAHPEPYDYSLAKSYSLEEARQARDRLRRSVRSGVWYSDQRPEFTVDLRHNRR